MSDELIKTLNSENTRLREELAQVRADAARDRTRKREAVTAKTALEAQIAELTTARDALQAKVDSAPANADARVKELETTLKQRDVKDAFRGVEGQLGEGVTLDKLFHVFGFNPSEADVAALKVDDMVGEWKKSIPGLFKAQEAENAPGGHNQRQRLTTDLPTGRAGPVTDAARFLVSRQDLTNPDWMQRNQARMSQAQAEGTLVYKD